MSSRSFGILLVLAAGIGQSQGQTMKIHTHGGVSEFRLSDIDSITFFIAPTHNDSDISSGLVLYYPFDQSLLDSSGNANNGGAANQSYTTDHWGGQNSAYLFNGANNFITVPDNSSLNPSNQLTVTVWLRIDSIQGNYMPMFVKGGPATSDFSNREYALYSKDNLGYWYPQWVSAGDGLGKHECLGDHHSYAVGQWVFFACVIDRAVNHSMEIFADGALTEHADDSYSSFNTSTYPLIIGWSQEAEGGLPDNAPFKGAMDNLRIYNRALTPGQILLLYQIHR